MVELLKIPDVAKILRVSQAMAYKMVKQGTLPVVRIGRSVRVPRDKLEQWVNRHSDRLDNGLDLMTIGDVAKYLSVSKNTAYALAKDGKIPAIRFGKNVRVSRAVLAAFIKDNMKGGAPVDKQSD